jgi:hypothetical protein
MNRIWVRRATSFEEAAAFDREYYASMTPEERLDTMQRLREAYFKLNKEHTADDGAARLRRHVEIIKPQ